MFLEALLRHGLRLLAPVAVASTIYLYLYPVFLGCAFPVVPIANSTSRWENGSPAAFFEAAWGHVPATISRSLRGSSSFSASSSYPSGSSKPRPKRRAAPFRLLALGDPQLEGDTSIPHAHGPRFPHLASLLDHVRGAGAHESPRRRLRAALHDLVDFALDDVPDEIESWRKRLDLLGNDYYLAHVYRTMDWWARPSHVTVLGDLVGSQWIDDDEFGRRADRYWGRVLRGTERVPDHLATYPALEYDLAAYLSDGGGGEEEEQDDDDERVAAAWRRRVINVAGNHDIGYAGDLDEARMARFERRFGKANYELRFELPVADPAVNATVFDPDTNPDSDRLPPEIRVVVLNDMNLDTPALSPALQDDTYAFVNRVVETSTAVEFRGHFTVVLTHVPLYKPEGVCIDDPYFDFFPDGDVLGSGVREQNQLSADASRGFLESIFGMSGDAAAPAGGRGRPGVVLNGHDHEGCDTYHFVNQSAAAAATAAADNDYDDERGWRVKRWRRATAERIPGADGVPGLREITVRSMMGDFGGNAGLLSAWFDEGDWTWRFEYSSCAVGRQHVWWAVHIMDVLVVVAALAYGVLALVTRLFAASSAGGVKGVHGGKGKGKPG